MEDFLKAVGGQRLVSKREFARQNPSDPCTGVRRFLYALLPEISSNISHKILQAANKLHCETPPEVEPLYEAIISQDNDRFVGQKSTSLLSWRQRNIHLHHPLVYL